MPTRPLRCLVVGDLGADERARVRAALPEDRLALVADGPGERPGPGMQLAVIGHGVGEPAARGRALRDHPEVTWVHTSAAGIDRIRLEVDRPGITVTDGVGISAVPIAEFVVACLLAHAKRLLTFAAQHRDRRWHSPELRELGDLRVVILGLGSIGRAVAARLVPFGAPVAGVRRDPGRGGVPGVARVVGPADLVDICTGADALVLAAPLTAATHGIVGARVFQALAPGSVMVNIARGAIVDEAALLSGLAAGRPAAAYLDALAEEPLPASSPLWSAPGVLVTSHTSWSSPRFAERSADLCAAQVRRRLAGRPLRNVADLGAGY